MQVLHSCDVRLCVRNDDVGTYAVGALLLPRRGHLFLGTQADNMADMAAKGRKAGGERNGLAKLTADQVRDMRRRYQSGGVSQPQLAREYGVHQATVWTILHRKTWAHVE